MPNLTILDFQSSDIRFETRDGRVWVSLTDMAKASGKRLGHWNELDSTKEFLSALESDMAHEGNGTILETMKGGVPSKQGTWAIEEVAIEFAGWCSIHFKIWMLQQIKTLMSQGYVALPQTQQPKLPSEEKAVKVAKAVAEIQNLLSDNNPRLAQFLIDHAISDLMPASNSLTGVKLKGVAEIAESLGLPVNLKNRSSLGKFVKKFCGHLAQQEERLVNGQQRNVACYPEDEPEVIQAVRNFFS